MAQPGRLGMTEVQKSELWHRWRTRGSGLLAIHADSCDRIFCSLHSSTLFSPLQHRLIGMLGFLLRVVKRPSRI